MFEIIRSESRGHVDHGWLNAKHTFSFADYVEPSRVRFGNLRVINEDRIAPGGGFDTHPHRDMEILTYPISGAVQHVDSMGNSTIIRAGEIQRMSAGTGVRHSEYNPSDTEELHLLQIWLFPERKGLEPSYEQANFSRADKLDQLRLIASRDGRDSSITIHQDLSLFAGILQADKELTHKTNRARRLFVQIIAGDISINGENLRTGDGAQIRKLERLQLRATAETELLIFDMG